MAQFKLNSVERETDLRNVSLYLGRVHGLNLEDDDSVSNISLSFVENETEECEGAESLPAGTGASDRPNSPRSESPPHQSPFYLHGVSWGFDIIRAADADDAEQCLDALKRDGVDPNTVVDSHGYGGHKWTHWSHRLAGDTILHLLLRWRRFKALAGLYPIALSGSHESGFFNLSARDSSGFTANELCQKELSMTLPEYWRKSRAAAFKEAEDYRRAQLASFEMACIAGHRSLLVSHNRAAEEYRRAVSRIGVGTESDELLGNRRIIAPKLFAPLVDSDARYEQRMNIWQSSGIRPLNHKNRRARPGANDEDFPVDLAEVTCTSLREVLTRIKDGDVVDHIRTNFELRYGGAIGSQGAVQLGLSLPLATRLTHLALPNQRIDVEGAKAIARGIKLSSSITYIDLRSNCLTDEGACSFAKTLLGNTHIKILCLDANRIDGPLTAMAIVSALHKLRAGNKCHCINHLSMTNNAIPEFALSQLHEAAGAYGPENGVMRIYPLLQTPFSTSFS